MARPGPIVLLLLAAAVGLLALSFAPWGRSPAAGDAPGAVVGAAPQETTASIAIPTFEPTPTMAERGRTLFSLKGCATCHRHDGLTAARLTQDGQVVPVSQSGVGVSGAPNLTHYQPDPEFIRTWLKDPQALRPGTRMPNLGLKESEIEALLAFLQTNTVEEGKN